MMYAVAAFDLRALGRLAEALLPMQTALEMDIKQQDWKNAAVDTGNISEWALTLGQIDTAVEATKIGAQSFLEKPITLQKLLKAVEQGLARTMLRSKTPNPPAAPSTTLAAVMVSQKMASGPIIPRRNRYIMRLPASSRAPTRPANEGGINRSCKVQGVKGLSAAINPWRGDS